MSKRKRDELLDTSQSPVIPSLNPVLSDSLITTTSLPSIVSSFTPRKKYRLPPKIESLNDLILFSESKKRYYGINMKGLKAVKDDLIKLDSLIGMKSLKDSILCQILYYLQGFNNDEFLNTIIYGPPGCGKTTVARILGNIYKNLGVLSPLAPDQDLKFIIAKRDDFIGKYVGHTAIKTRALLESAKGGILFIDEAYSMGTGNESNSDSFAKEAVEVLNEFLSENKEKFCCIVAGYEDMVKRCFFSLNPGLERRFAWVHKIDKYNPEDWSSIFIDMLNKIGWVYSMSREKLNNIFQENQDLFPFDGGSIELFLTKCKMAHSRRVFNKDIVCKYILIEEDILEGINLMRGNSQKPEENKNYLNLYL